MTVQISLMGYGFPLVSGSEDASAFDIKTPVDFTIRKNRVTIVPLGIKSAIPTGMLGQMSPRSGLGSKGVHLANVLGIIDSDYRGEWQARMTLAGHAEEDEMSFKAGDRVLQVAFKYVSKDIEYVKELSDTKRGADGFGSTGV